MRRAPRPGLYYSRNPRKKPPDWVTIDHGAARCPACEASGSLDHGASLLPLFYGDPAAREERCTHCDRPLVDILAAEQRARPLSVVHTIHGPAKSPALRFTAAPPPFVDDALRTAGWLLHRPSRTWFWCRRGPAQYPAALALPPPVPPRIEVIARPPTIRRRNAR